MPRYERIFPLVAIVVMGLGLILLIEGINNLTVAIPLPGELEARVSIAWLILFFLLIVVAVGTETVQYEEAEEPGTSTPRSFHLHPVCWIVPVLLTLTSFLFLRLLQGGVARAIGIGVTAGLLSVALVAQHYTHRGEASSAHLFEARYLVLDVLVYVTSFFLYGAIYTLKVRSLFSATSIVVVTFLLAVALLHRLAPWARVRLSAGIVGLCVGQVTWPLNYWAINGMIGGAFLLVAFYALANQARLDLQGRWTLRVGLEYVVLVLLGIGLLVLYAFRLWPFY